MSAESFNLLNVNNVGPDATHYSVEAQPDQPATSGQEVFERLLRDGEPGAQGFVPYTRTDPDTGREIHGWETVEARAAAPTQTLDATLLRQTLAAAPTAYLPRIPTQRSGPGVLSPLPQGHMRMRESGQHSIGNTSSSALGRVGIFNILAPAGQHRAPK